MNVPRSKAMCNIETGQAKTGNVLGSDFYPGIFETLIFQGLLLLGNLRATMGFDSQEGK